MRPQMPWGYSTEDMRWLSTQRLTRLAKSNEQPTTFNGKKPCC